MQERHLYEYAVIRFVPKVEREAYKKMSVKGNKIILEFTNQGKKLMIGTSPYIPEGELVRPKPVSYTHLDTYQVVEERIRIEECIFDIVFLWQNFQ